MLSMYQQITIKTLFEQSKKKTEIARTLNCHRNTVANILNRDTLIEKQTREKSSVYQPYKETIKTWLEDKKLTRVRIHEKLKEEYQVHGSYDALRRFIRKHIPQPIEAFGIEEHLPGEEVEVDFGDIWVRLTDENKRRKFYLLAFVLPFSGKKYYELCDNQKAETFYTGFTHEFSFYGGVPKKVKPDNLKAAVNRNERFVLEFNQSFLEFSYHYRFVIHPCTPYSPEQKGTVESGIKYAQQNFVPGRTFRNREDLKQQLHRWTGMVNKKVHGTTREVINDRFNRLEKERLQPLPVEAFSFFNRAERVVGINCHIHFENNYYSVPFSYVKKTVTIRWNQCLLRIIYGGEELALHKICPIQGKYVTVREHLPSNKIYSETEFQLQHENKMRRIGLNAHKYFIMLLQKQPGQWRQTIRPIYGLVAEYGEAAVDKALERALSYGAKDTRIIRNILTRKLYEVEDVIKLPEFTDSTNSRELSYYCLSNPANSLEEVGGNSMEET